jgi:hypothetical protein
VLAHDRQKRVPLPSGKRDEYLVAVGIMTPEGRVKAERYDKFRQVNEFLRLLGQTVSAGDGEQRPEGPEGPEGQLPDSIVDLGCGNAYLTFATYHYFRDLLAHPVAMCGVDVSGDLLEGHRAKTARLGWEGLTFVAGTISDFSPARPPDLVLALHACDTATDDAIARTIGWRSRLLLSVPCCHHDLQQQLRKREDATALKPVYRYGVLAERLGDVVTDTLRALILRICGYRCDVVQFVSPEHTAKNLMIRATRTGRIGDPVAVEEYLRLRAFLGVTPYLERILGDELRVALAGGRAQATARKATHPPAARRPRTTTTFSPGPPVVGPNP